MAEWEREVFEKEYADINWYKGKQAKHVKEMELGRKRSKLGAYHTSRSFVNRSMVSCSFDVVSAEDI